ncbi:MAG: penicillin-binding protein 2 [Pseudomonadota bacterium]
MRWIRRRKKPKAYVVAQTQVGTLRADRFLTSINHCTDYKTDHPRAGLAGYSAATITSKLARRAKLRIGMAGLGIACLFGALGVRLAHVSFQPDQPMVRFASLEEASGPRPDIVDREGVLLATNLPTIALEVAGNEVWDAAETAAVLAKVVEGVDPARLERKLKRGLNVEVRTDLSPVEQADVFALGLPGVHFSRRDMRFYPQGGLAPHLVGYLEKSPARRGAGAIMGLEHVLDKTGQAVPLAASIDLRVQQVLEDVLAERMTEFQAEAAWGGIMDVTTGEMIAMASFPEFDVNAPGASPTAARRNRFTYDRYDLGSAFKVITAASILETGLANEATPYDARGGFRVPGFTVTDYHPQNRVLTLSEVVQYSSNIGVARMAQAMGPALQQEYLGRLGFFAPLPIELLENRAPDLPKKWGPVEAATVSYGHGIAVTPLHLLAGFAATLNDGVFRVPTFLKTTGSVSQSRDDEPVYSPQTTATMRRILRRTILSGTAKKAEVPGYYPIGKTATADKPGPGGYLKNARISSFVGAFPGYAPRYAVLVSLDNPQPTADTHGYATAGWTAAPAFHDVVARAAPILNVPTVGDDLALPQFLAPQSGGRLALSAGDRGPHGSTRTRARREIRRAAKTRTRTSQTSSVLASPPSLVKTP